MAECCDKWWASLDDHMKEWVHYYFYDINGGVGHGEETS